MTSSPLRKAISDVYLADEDKIVAERIAQARLSPDEARATHALARKARHAASARRARSGGGVDAFMQEYSLSSQEGVALMCLAEALLRVPDSETADKLIRDKIGSARLGRATGTNRTRCSSTPRPGR